MLRITIAECECSTGESAERQQPKSAAGQVPGFHLSRAIMKIEVMQMNKSIAIGKYVIVLSTCHAQLHKGNIKMCIW